MSTYPSVTFFRRNGIHYAVAGTGVHDDDAFKRTAGQMIAEMGITEYKFLDKTEAIRQAIVSELMVELSNLDQATIRGEEDLDIYYNFFHEDSRSIYVCSPNFGCVEILTEEQKGQVYIHEGTGTEFAEWLEREKGIPPLQAIAIKDLAHAGLNVRIRKEVTRSAVVTNLVKGLIS